MFFDVYTENTNSKITTNKQPSTLKWPPKDKKRRGRPAGSTATTVMGLPRPRTRKPKPKQAAECAKRDKTAQKKERKERVINYYSESCGESGDESGGDSEDSLYLSGYVSRRTRWTDETCNCHIIVTNRTVCIEIMLTLLCIMACLLIEINMLHVLYLLCFV